MTELINPRLNLAWTGCWKPGYVEQSRYLYDHELVFFTAGKSQVVLGEQSFTCSKGDVLIIPPGVRHWTRVLDEKVERHCFHFDWVHGLAEPKSPFVFEASGEYRRSQSKPAPRWLKIRLPFYSKSIPLQQSLPLLHQLAGCNADVPEGNLRRRGLFLQLLSELLAVRKMKGETVHGGKSLRLVQSVKQRIEKDFRQALSMSSLAREFKVSPVHMARAFRIVVGMSPLQYVHRLRLEEAYRLLSTSAKNVSETAMDVGFDNANYFSRLFRKKMGMPPSSVPADRGSRRFSRLR